MGGHYGSKHLPLFSWVLAPLCSKQPPIRLFVTCSNSFITAMGKKPLQYQVEFGLSQMTES